MARKQKNTEAADGIAEPEEFGQEVAKADSPRMEFGKLEHGRALEARREAKAEMALTETPESDIEEFNVAFDEVADALAKLGVSEKSIRIVFGIAPKSERRKKVQKEPAGPKGTRKINVSD